MMDSDQVEHLVTIEEALNLTSGTRKYQKLLMIIIIPAIAIMNLMNANSYKILQLEFDYNDAENTLDRSIENDQNITIFIIVAYVGGLIGFLFPWLSDRYGRKKILKILCLIGGISLILLALSLNNTVLRVAGFLIGATTNGMICISVILCVETIDFKKRSQYIGYLFTTVLASNELSHFFISSLELWRNFMLCCAFLMILNFFAMSYIEESPRFLLTNQANIKASTKVIEKISLWNGEGDFKYSLVSENIKKQKRISWKDLCNSKIMKSQLIVCTLVWSSLYVGSSSIANIRYTPPSDIWIHCSIYILGILPVLILMIFINGIGRKKIIAWILFIMGLIFYNISLLLCKQKR